MKYLELTRHHTLCAQQDTKPLHEIYWKDQHLSRLKQIELVLAFLEYGKNYFRINLVCSPQ